MGNYFSAICWSINRIPTNEASKFQKNDRKKWYILLFSAFTNCFSGKAKKALSGQKKENSLFGQSCLKDYS